MGYLKKRRKSLITIAFLLVVTLIAVLAVRMVEQPVNARTITTTPPTIAKAPPPPSLIPVSNVYASFSYPDSLYPEQNAPTAESPVLASYNYVKPDIQTWVLAVDFTQLKSPSLNMDSSYVIRKVNPAEYQESNVTYGNNTFIVMNDTVAVGFSETAFILRGDMDATISLTGNDAIGISGLETVFQQVLQSWKWQ